MFDKIRKYLLSRRRRSTAPIGTPSIGARAIVSRDSLLEDFVNVAAGAQLTRGCRIGCRTSIGRDSKLQGAHIGRYCSISWNVTVGALSHPMDHLSMHAFPVQRRFGIVDKNSSMPRSVSEVYVGNDVWIGCHAVILSGVKVGDGAVIGAGSVVTHDVPAFAVVAGVPARILRYRFSADQIERLLRLQWWKASDEDLKKAVDNGLFSSAFNDRMLADLECRLGVQDACVQSRAKEDAE